MSQSDYRACVYMASSKLNLKCENLTPSVMYYEGEGGGLLDCEGGGGGNKPAKTFKMHIG